MTGERVDLNRLPAWLQYLIALSVVAVVVGAAWAVGRDDPVPGWITHYLIPALGWLYIVLVVYVLLFRLLRQRAGRRARRKG